MFKNESCSTAVLKKISKYLCKTEASFLDRLNFWASHKNGYGIEKWGRTWIYNTLEDWGRQLGASKRSTQRAIKSLKDKGIVDSEYLSPNKRNRTLFYSINYEKLHECLSALESSSSGQTKTLSCGQIKAKKISANDHMDDHVYLYSKQSINKSYKSRENEIKKSLDHAPQENFDVKHDKTLDTKTEITELTETAHQKPTIVQDMLRIWKEELPKSEITLSKQLARFLVAVFKTKFSSCLKEWKKYLKILKTSTYIMSEKFKLSIWWVIKFVTVDRIKKGELGVNPDKITYEKEELTEKLNLHISSIDETEPCKKLRYKIIEKLSLQVYLSWFIHVDFIENNGKIVMKAKNTFVRDWIRDNFADTCGLCLE
jgi:hypothetical protein